MFGRFIGQEIVDKIVYKPFNDINTDIAMTYNELISPGEGPHHLHL